MHRDPNLYDYWPYRDRPKIVAICDVDEEVGKSRVERVKKRSKKEPAYYRDLRKLRTGRRARRQPISRPGAHH